ncbi:quercetin dioxygenase-like cupin family protein [Cytobacillus purgationiresistens]|uniref:Quercetin dioxygenase-like cupin family protein n=1 Tax=Cytobacillus purgationiresistens TaxID=863449 RepID=A0ABU0ACI9_9BACI|nr:quercetin dioxygenase-like cupin family protein [Cytobacillus purgationiresistens]
MIKEGKLTLELQGMKHELGSGDALQFSGVTPHSYHNLTKDTASFFMLTFHTMKLLIMTNIIN